MSETRAGEPDELSRRAALRRVGAGGIAVAGMALLTDPSAASAASRQSGDADAPSRDDLLALAEGIVGALNSGDPDAFDTWIAEDVVGHVPLASPEPGTGREWIKEKTALAARAASDAVISLDGVAIDGDLIAAHGRLRGAHDGEFLGFAPTGRAVEIAYVVFVRVADGKAVEYWYQVDALRALEQVGLFALDGDEGSDADDGY